MMWLAWAIAFASGIGGTVYMVATGHPWWAAAVLLITGSLKVSTSEKRRG